jgi:hypothetical protein
VGLFPCGKMERWKDKLGEFAPLAVRPGTPLVPAFTYAIGRLMTHSSLSGRASRGYPLHSWPNLPGVAPLRPDLGRDGFTLDSKCST